MNYARRFARRAASRKHRRQATKDQTRRGLLAERLEERSLMAGDLNFHSDYWNMSKPTDVNADGMVTPSDALAIINRLNSQGSHALAQGVSGESASGKVMYIDTNNDGWLTPSDALRVINQINAEGQTPPNIVNYTVQTLDSQGNPTTSVTQGQDFYLQLIGHDLRPNGTNPDQSPLLRGVDFAYADVIFDTTKASVAVNEVQTLTITGGTTGSFTLTDGTHTTASINYDQTSLATRTATAAAMQTALNAVLGANIVTVKATTATKYTITYSDKSQINVDEPLLSASANATVAETIKGDPTSPAAMLAASTFNSNIVVPDPNGGADHVFAYDTSQHIAPLPNTSDSRTGINALGAGNFSSLTPVAIGFTNDPIEVVRVHMIAAPLPTGVVSTTDTFTPDATITNDQTGPYNSAFITQMMANLNAKPDPEPSDVPTPQITYTPTTLTISAGPIYAKDFTAPSVNEDSGPDVINLLDPAITGVNPGNTGSVVINSVTAVNPAADGTVSLSGGNATFTPGSNFNGNFQFTYVAQHKLANGSLDTSTGAIAPPATITIPVAAVNDAPTLTLPGPQTTAEDTAKAISGITVADVDADAGGGLQLTLSVGHGTLHVTPGAGVTGNDTGSVTITGLVAAVNSAAGSLTYTPAQDFNTTTASESLTANVNDLGHSGGAAQQLTKSVAITVTAVNDAPVITAPSSASVAFVDTLQFSGANAITVTDVDAGTDNIQTAVSLSNLGTATLHVNPTGGATITAGANDSASLTLTGPQAGINATLATMVLTPGGSNVFTGGTLAINVSDLGHNPAPAQTASKNVTIDIVPPVKPFAISDAINFDEGTTAAQTINVLGNDLVDTGTAAELESFTQPLNGAPGTVTLFDNGTLTDKTDDKLVYTPPGGDFNGTVQFTYVMNETPATNSAGPSTGTVTVTINAVNDPPVAVNDSYQTAIGVPLTVAANGVLANDTDVDDPVSSLTAVNAVIAAGQGTVTLNTNGGFVYTPPAGGGDFSFTYQAKDPHGALSLTPATVSIHVAAPPVAVPDAYTATEDTPLVISTRATGVLGNDQDPTEHQEATMTATLVTNVPAAAGSVVLNADGTFTYTPAPDFNTTRVAPNGTVGSPVTFTYKASASGRDSNVTTVSLTVNEVNDNPVANPDTFLGVKQQGSIGVDQPVSVLGNDTIGPDVAETLKVTAVNGVAADANGNVPAQPTALGGSVRLSNYQILYTSPTVTGNDTFTYTVSDFDATTGQPRGGHADATVTVNVVEFVPKVISGTVFIDGNNNGNVDSGEKPLAGVQINLTGTDFTGAAVNISTLTDLNGNYSFGGTTLLKPPQVGTHYTITEVQPAFLLNGIDKNSLNSPLVTDANPLDNLFTIAYAVTDQATLIGGLTFGERGIDIGSLTDASGFINDYMSKSGPNGFVIDASISGASAWSYSLPGWQNAKTMSVTLDTSLAFITITGTDGQNNPFSVVLHQQVSQNVGFPAGSLARFYILGTGANGQYILRIDGGPADMGLNLLAATSTSAGGEGEAPAGQYAQGADAVFAEGNWA